MKQNSVLLVIDVQNGFVREKSKHVVPEIVDVVDRWQNAGLPVVFTRYINYPDSPYERMIHWTRMRTLPDIDLAPEIAPYAEQAIVMDKPIYSFFTKEGLALVKEYGWTDFYMCGIATESCVLKTAVDAFEMDLTPWVIKDASTSHAGQEAHDAGILVTSRFIGRSQVIDKQTVLSELEKLPSSLDEVAVSR